MTKSSITIGESFCLGITLGYAYRCLKNDRLQNRPQRLFFKSSVSDEENPIYATYDEAFGQLDSYQQRGFECVPTCNNTDEKGRCLGHKTQ